MSKHSDSHANSPKHARRRGGCCLGSLIGGAIRMAFMAAGGWIAYSHLKIDHQLPLPKALPAEQMWIPFPPSGTLNAYVERTGAGRPLVLIHSVNAAADAYEMRPLFQRYRSSRPVLALDLPGFGFSTRPDIDYTPDLFAQAVIAALQQFDGTPADVIALSLGSEFAAQAARRRPDLLHSLTLISPSSLSRQPQSGTPQAIQQRAMSDRAHNWLRIRLWARPFYDLLTTRRSIQYFLQKSFTGAVPPDLVDHAYATAHQPGAEHAPLTFVSGKLFTPDAMQTLYRLVTTPTLVVYDQDAFVSFDLLPELLRQNPTWRAERITPTLGLPHFERLGETAQAIERFWAELE